MQNIEVEVRSFITKEQYDTLLNFFKDNAKHVKEDYQETYYFRFNHRVAETKADTASAKMLGQSFDAHEDLRIQRNNTGSKLWLKKGKIHDFCREEIEIKFPREDFEKLENLLNALGFGAKIKWFRNRKQFDWSGIKTCLDFTKGYGYIIELEKLCSEHEKSSALEELKNKMKELGISITPKEEFDSKFKYYEENWKELTGEK